MFYVRRRGRPTCTPRIWDRSLKSPYASIIYFVFDDDTFE